jgi:outer membrane protein TolC
MSASGNKVRRRVRRITWRAAGATVLGLLGGSTGCSLSHDETLPPAARGLAPAALAPMNPFPSGKANASAGPDPGKASPAAGAAEEQQAEGGKRGSYQVQKELAGPAGGLVTPAIPPPCEVRPVQLADVLTLAGVENPTILLAEQAVQSSLALQLQARVLLLPNLNVGGDYDDHTGPTQNSFGAIRDLPVRQSAYLGMGSGAIVAGSVAYPGIWMYSSLSNALFEPKIASRVVTQRSFEAAATRNDVLLDVAVGYLQLLGSEGRLAVLRQTQMDLAEVVRLTEAFSTVQVAKKADADRARDDALMMEVREKRAQEEVAVAAAELARLLNLDPSIRLQIANDPIVVVRLIDPQLSLPELVQIARNNRPELKAVAAEIAAARGRVSEEKARPFLPTLSVGYSEGGFGGGPTVVLPSFSTPGATFTNLRQRTDVDAFAWWTLQNMGLGNLALVRRRKAEVGQAEGRRGVLVNQIDREVADAFNLSQARFREVEVARRQVESAVQGFQRDLARIREFVGLPIELLNSADLLFQARLQLLGAIIAFDESQFRLFVALGQPPTLAVADDTGGK